MVVYAFALLKNPCKVYMISMLYSSCEGMSTDIWAQTQHRHRKEAPKENRRFKSSHLTLAQGFIEFKTTASWFAKRVSEVQRLRALLGDAIVATRVF